MSMFLRCAVAISAGETMPDSQAKDSNAICETIQRKRQERERRAQPRNNGVLARIEDATYEVLRKHEKQTA